MNSFSTSISFSTTLQLTEVATTEWKCQPNGRINYKYLMNKIENKMYISKKKIILYAWYCIDKVRIKLNQDVNIDVYHMYVYTKIT